MKKIILLIKCLFEITGSLEGIAPTEKIYSARFIGDKVYIVTFKETDPLFVIDLKDVSNPKILGALKIPGYSNYLHPYDENHLIGFGKEVAEEKNGQFIERGMKIGMFDITDLKNPKEKYKIEIGGKGTTSELLHNHKSLMDYNNIMAFPITIYDDYNFKFQGAQIYNVSKDEGFTLKSEISHLTNEDYKRSGTYYYDDNGNAVNRIIAIGDIVHTISNNEIRAFNLSDFEQINSLRY